MEGLSKQPDEIKKGLGWCSRDTTICTETCPYYGSLSNGVECASELQADALAYIQQLETKCHQLEREREAMLYSMEQDPHCCFHCNGIACTTSKAKGDGSCFEWREGGHLMFDWYLSITHLQAENAELQKRIKQLEREKDALLTGLKHADLDCEHCMHCNVMTDVCKCDCSSCELDADKCPCNECGKNSHWEWAGIKDDNQ